MNRIEMQWYCGNETDTKDNIGQIYSNGLEFACATKTKQCSHFVYCKDFLHDAVWAQLYNKEIEIHGFKFDSAKNPIDLDLTRMLMANSSDEHFASKIPAVLDFIHQVEKVLKLRRTTAEICENPSEEYDNGVFLLESSQRWMSSPPLLSMYTLLLRCGFVHTVGDDFIKTLNGIQSGDIKAYQGNDQDFLVDSRPAIDLILALGYRKIFFIDIKKNYPEYLEASVLHHDFGIRGYCWATETKSRIPYWHRKALLDALAAKGITIEKLWEKPIQENDIQGPPPEGLPVVNVPVMELKEDTAPMITKNSSTKFLGMSANMKKAVANSKKIAHSKWYNTDWQW
jgi:hypothetical protein